MEQDIIDREFRSVPHEDKLYSRLVMSTNIRAAALHQNAELQKNPDALRDLDWARWSMSIPELDWHHLKIKYPDLASSDHGIYNAALAKFTASSESAPYRVR